MNVDMVNKSDLEDLHDDDVISINSNMIKAGKFKQELREAIWCDAVAIAIRDRLKSNGVDVKTLEYGIHGTPNNKLKEGIDIELLRIVGKSWQKGQVKISISLDFYSDEPEIPEVSKNHMSELSLDDIRRTISRNN